MKKNVGSTDQTIRLLMAAILAGLVAFEKVDGTSAIALLFAAAYLLITGITGICLLYSIFGLDTTKATNAAKSKDTMQKSNAVKSLKTKKSKNKPKTTTTTRTTTKSKSKKKTSAKKQLSKKSSRNAKSKK